MFAGHLGKVLEFIFFPREKMWKAQSGQSQVPKRCSLWLSVMSSATKCSSKRIFLGRRLSWSMGKWFVSDLRLIQKFELRLSQFHTKTSSHWTSQQTSATSSTSSTSSWFNSTPSWKLSSYWYWITIIQSHPYQHLGIQQIDTYLILLIYVSRSFAAPASRSWVWLGWAVHIMDWSWCWSMGFQRARWGHRLAREPTCP